MADEVVIVFTAKSIERIVREGGTSAWRLDRQHARQCKFAICTRNSNADWAQGQEPHRSAFLIGKVRDVVPCEATPENDETEEDRYLIQFSEYATLNLPDLWRKGDRNPVRYSGLEELSIGVSTLHWEPMPEPMPHTEAEDNKKLEAAQPLTIQQAKIGLALTFNVKPEAVEIVIRG